MTEGSGGNASAILASLTAVSNSSFDLEGGEAANDLGSGNGGTGGNAAMVVSGPVSVDGTQVLVKGGAGGNSSSANAGSGGDSGLFLGSAFTLTGVQGSSTWIVIGGEGGIGKGSSGGSAGITASGPLSLDASTIDLTGGNGDMGGGVALTLNSAFLNHFSDLRLTGGNGWSGTGGSVQVSIGALDLADSGSELSVQGGFGPANGSADVTIGALTGAGVLSIGDRVILALEVTTFGPTWTAGRPAETRRRRGWRRIGAAGMAAFVRRSGETPRPAGREMQARHDAGRPRPLSSRRSGRAPRRRVAVVRVSGARLLGSRHRATNRSAPRGRP